ncbi:Nucleolar protein 16 [Dipsacomyces acuminosporus]|nr:Nucleolar protein 16 [Dipsacomyces acuminosporus]
MVRPVARKKLRNPKLKTTRRRANKARNKKFTGHHLLQDKWDPSLTLSENYRNMGLVARVNGISGGIVKPITSTASQGETAEGSSSSSKAIDAENLSKEELKKLIPQGYGIIERDEEGNVVNVIMAEEPHDPLDSDVEIESVKPKMEAARILEEYANSFEERKERWISQGERRKLQAFIDRHGDNYTAMFRDKDLNKQQLTATQLKKKIEGYLKDKKKALGPFPE